MAKKCKNSKILQKVDLDSVGVGLFFLQKTPIENRSLPHTLTWVCRILRLMVKKKQSLLK